MAIQSQKKEIPFDKKREFDPKLAPGTEEVVQKGENGENNHNTNNEKSINRRKELVKVSQQKNHKRASG